MRRYFALQDMAIADPNQPATAADMLDKLFAIRDWSSTLLLQRSGYTFVI
jgi:hypothetical protein